ncbi:uncharacterized protein CLUP02_01347 [Colletotrichum lupini]|uniref:Uncharacterized protein n=1 Tax=Colletotrichum lupini TaxID=145971 RepID=A0A9Q8SCW2_9PEZI|nr:uncharacterized protein CLUP02_01347 [Colletotrichum lupini]UQC74695.1 hypothetical protein CLUP02_01347 [Colletotrichum lupini]
MSRNMSYVAREDGGFLSAFLRNPFHVPQMVQSLTPNSRDLTAARSGSNEATRGDKRQRFLPKYLASRPVRHREPEKSGDRLSRPVPSSSLEALSASGHKGIELGACTSGIQKPSIDHIRPS